MKKYLYFAVMCCALQPVFLHAVRVRCMARTSTRWLSMVLGCWFCADSAARCAAFAGSSTAHAYVPLIAGAGALVSDYAVRDAFRDCCGKANKKEELEDASMIQYHYVVEKIKALLTESQCCYETFEHEPVRTSEEAATTRPGYTLSQGAKALLVRVKISNAIKSFVMLVFPADKRFDADKVKMLLGAKDIRFATEEEVDQITDGVQPGGVPPFGNLFDVKVIVDASLLNNEKIVFNAGDKSFSIAMRTQDYVKIVDPQVADIVL